MKFTVHEDAAKWYKEEMGLEEGTYIRIYTKLYGGIETIFPDFYLGISIGEEEEYAAKDTVEGITFYIKKADDWIISKHDLEVRMGEEETQFHFIERS